MPWCASRCWWPTGRRAGPVFDAGNDPPVRRGPTRRPRRSIRGPGRPLAVLRRSAKPTSSPCRTAPASVRPTTGSPPSWPICAPHSGGPPTTATSTSPPPSPRMRRSSACGVRNLCAGRLGRRAHRARPRRRPPPARVPVRDGVAVLPGRTDRGGCPLQRRRPDRARREPRGAAVRHRSLAWRLCTWSSASPNGRPSGAASSSHAAATPTSHIRAWLVVALSVAGSGGEAMDSADGLIDAAEATAQPVLARVRRSAAHGFAFRDADPVARA